MINDLQISSVQHMVFGYGDTMLLIPYQCLILARLKRRGYSVYYLFNN